LSERRDEAPAARARRQRPQAEARDVLAFFDHGGEAYFGYRMTLAAKLFDRSIAAILAANGDLTLPEWRALSQLGLRGDASVRTLADGAAVDRAEASRAVGALAARGLVERRENAADLRSPRFHLTPAGEETFARIRGPIAGFIAQLVEGVDADRLAAANEVLRAVIRGCLAAPE
jgi:MarR family transcriptional regulator for hemolysin